MKKRIALLLLTLICLTACQPAVSTTAPTTTAPTTTAPTTTAPTQSSSTEATPGASLPADSVPENTTPSNTEHVHDYASRVVDPTCTADGYTTYTCACGHSYTDGLVDALGHDMGDWFTVDENTERRNCDRCGSSEDRKPEPKAYTREGEYIIFGSWPQSQVTDNSLVIALSGSYATTLPTADSSGDWTSYGYYTGKGGFGAESVQSDYMWYRDVEYNGQRYRGVYFTSYRPAKANDTSDTSFQDNNGYATGMVHWFRWEPVKWRIIREQGGKAMLLCEMLIDAQAYNYTVKNREESGSNAYASNYAYSSIRAWLNETFYEQAFTHAQQKIIRETTVDNSAASTADKCHHLMPSNGFECADTQDRLFLLSFYESTDSQYGFGTCNGGGSLPRSKFATDYAKCQGLYVNNNGMGRWWQRSPAWSNFSAFFTSTDGYPDSSGDVVCINGVCPVLWIAL